MEKIKINLSVPNPDTFEVLIKVGSQEENVLFPDEIMSGDTPEKFFEFLTNKIEDLLEKELIKRDENRS